MIEKAIIPRVDPREKIFIVILYDENDASSGEFVCCETREKLNQLIEKQKSNPGYYERMRIFSV